MSPLNSFFLGLCIACIFALLYDIRDRVGKSPKVERPKEAENAAEWDEWMVGIMQEHQRLQILVRRLSGMHDVLELRQNADRQRIQALERLVKDLSQHMREFLWENYYS